MDVSTHITNSLSIRLLVVALALFSPLACYFISGPMPSYSQYWETPMQPLFIFTNAATSYYLFSMRRWWLASVLLLLLTAFSNSQYFWIHNTVAVLFFVVSGWTIATAKRGSLFIIPYLAGIVYLIFTRDIFWAEVVGIHTVCLFHLHYMLLYVFTKRLKFSYQLRR